MNKVCYGCGVKLQSDDILHVGYVPKEKIDTALYCMRCFRMMNYGENSFVCTPKESKEIINKVNKDNRFVIFLVDFLNINREVINLFKSINKKKVLVVNKCELIPKHIKKERITEYLKKTYEIEDDIKLKGGNLSHGAKSILNYLENSHIKEAYILGISNSGKSTLINDLINLNNSKVAKINVNSKSNTTLDFLRVRINDNLTIIDSPGFIIDNSLNHDVSNKNITSYSFQVKAGQTLSLIDEEIFLKFSSDTSLTFYTNALANKVIKKYYKAAPSLVNNIKIEKENTDIILIGIGFIAIKNPCIITTNIDLLHIELRNSMFGGPYE